MSPMLLPADKLPWTSSDGLVIRQAMEADLAAIAMLLSFMHEEEASPDQIAQAYEEILGESNWRIILLAEWRGAIVGTLDLFVLRNLTRGGMSWAGIENVVVHPEARRNGIGTQLIQIATRLAQDANCYKAQLISHNRRDAAHRLYEKCGFNADVRGYRRYLAQPPYDDHGYEPNASAPST